MFYFNAVSISKSTCAASLHKDGDISRDLAIPELFAYQIFVTFGNGKR